MSTTEQRVTTARVEALAKRLMKQHGVPSSWTFGWDRAGQRFGACHHGPKKITLSSVITPHRTWDEIEQVMLHEIAHVLAPPKMINGRWDKHGSAWLRKAREIGYRGGVTGGEVPAASITSTYVGTCQKCGIKVPRTKRPPVLGQPCGYSHKADRGTIIFTLNR